MAKLAADPAAVKAEAARMRLGLKRLSAWQQRFLNNLEEDGILPSRFWETFADLKARSSVKNIVGRYRAYDLLVEAYEARLDLDDEDAEEFLKEMVSYGMDVALSEGQWKYLFAICRRLHIIEDEYIPFE